MDLAVLPSTIPVPVNRNRQVRPLTEQLARTGLPGEQVLQGELLSRDRPGARTATREAAEYLNGRREDHPAFQPRFENESLQQRRALESYGNIEETGSGRAAHTLDILV